MRTVAVVTTSRADFGAYLPVLRCIEANRKLQLRLIVTGTHLSKEYGLTMGNIEGEGFDVSERMDMSMASDSPQDLSYSMGQAVAAFAEVFGRWCPDILLVLGDRYEMHAAALAALPFKIPVAHIHGGEITVGAIDDALRHSITKLSHLHFVATKEYERRVVQMGEAPWRVTVSGAPSLDNLDSLDLLTESDLGERLNFSIGNAPLLVTYHPVTLEYENTEWQITELLEALTDFNAPKVITAPNADTSGAMIVEMLRDFANSHSSVLYINNLGTQMYFSLMAIASAMVGNSSSGIIEAPSFGLPVVNIGTRQEGRIRASNVIDVGYSAHEIREGIRVALASKMRASLQEIENPYRNGKAAETIVEVLAGVRLDSRLLLKRFHDIPVEPPIASTPVMSR